VLLCILHKFLDDSVTVHFTAAIATEKEGTPSLREKESENS
jgi:hypothetical protein